jgi:hypothetical protein
MKQLKHGTGGRTMSKLIEADLLSDKIRENKELLQKGLGKDAEFAFMTADSVLKLIENQPTAYDVDKVVKQLEAYSNADEAERLGTMPVVELADAIKIVKGGGVNG